MIDIDGTLEVLDIPADPGEPPDSDGVEGAREPAIVLLHEGLGSVGLWREFPKELHAATGRRVVAYARHGHGRSDPPPRARTPRFMHEEALDVLPGVLERLWIERPLLVGHSDGASIGLIHAAHHRVQCVVAIAPHVFVEPQCLEEIREARTAYEAGELRERMRKHHRDPDQAFYGWNDVWLDPAFRTWDIRPELGNIDAPVLLIQGILDQYGTLAQLDEIERAVRGPVTRRHVDCRHAPHQEKPEETLAAISDFINGLPRAGTSPPPAGRTRR